MAIEELKGDLATAVKLLESLEGQSKALGEDCDAFVAKYGQVKKDRAQDIDNLGRVKVIFKSS